MSRSSRLESKAMLESWGAFDMAIKLSEQALSANKYEHFSNMSLLVHEKFFNFDKEYRNYKVNKKEKSAKSEETFSDEQREESIFFS